jgi:hypothetical protein
MNEFRVRNLIKKHGIAGPVLCVSIISLSVYGVFKSIEQIRKEWRIIKRSSRQEWKTRLEGKSDDIHT